MLKLSLHNPHFEILYKEFKLYIEAKGYSKGRRAPYPLYLREFLFFIEQHGISKIQDVIATDIISYYDYLQQRPNQRTEGALSDSYIKGHLFGLRLFFDYLLDSEQIQASPANLPKFQISQYKQRNILSLEEIKQLYAVCCTRQDKALLGIAYGCGLRRSEIQNLDNHDVLLHKGMLVVREGKFGKSRTVPLSDTVIKDLKEYLLYERSHYFQHSNHATHSFFVSKQGKRMTGAYLNKRLKELVNLTQNQELIRKDITLHCLRHSIATHLLDKGASIEFVQQLLGHAEIDTAHLYSKRRKQHLHIKKQTY